MTIKLARETTLRLILDNDFNTALALFDALHLSAPEAMTLLGEIPVLRAQGAPDEAFRSWHADLCAFLRRQMAEADAKSKANAWLTPKPGNTP